MIDVESQRINDALKSLQECIAGHVNQSNGFANVAWQVLGVAIKPSHIIGTSWHGFLPIILIVEVTAEFNKEKT